MKWLLASLLWGASSPQELTLARLKELKEGPCTFVHVWATSCDACLVELPKLIEQLATSKKVRPIVIDVSTEKEQVTFSKKWVMSLSPSFTPYVKPIRPKDPKYTDLSYIEAIDEKWSGTMPYSALYHRGKRGKIWIGALSFSELETAVAQTCY